MGKPRHSDFPRGGLESVLVSRSDLIRGSPDIYGFLFSPDAANFQNFGSPSSRDSVFKRQEEKLEDFVALVEDGSTARLTMFQRFVLCDGARSEPHRVNTLRIARCADGRRVQCVTREDFVILDPERGGLRATRIRGESETIEPSAGALQSR